MKTLLRLSCLLCLFNCTTQTQPESFQAGFTVVSTKDTTRIYRPGVPPNDTLYHRPLDLDLWYPIQTAAADTTLAFGDLLGLLESRANYYTASQAGNGLAQQLAQYLCDNLKCADPVRLLKYKTQSHPNAAPAGGKFPLVIYLSAFNGMSYENFALGEALAQQGFVVVSISSIGRFPGDMTMKKEDLLEQVHDAVAAVGHLRQFSYIDFTKIGIVGYSWGGLAGVVLASQLPNTACLVSLDGSEFHHFGADPEEDADFADLTNSAIFREMKLTVPYLRLASARPIDPAKPDTVYQFADKHTSQPKLMVIDSAKHEDFSALPQVVRASGQCHPTPHFAKITELTLDFLQKHLKK
jgi:dienelactone hydrolase